MLWLQTLLAQTTPPTITLPIDDIVAWGMSVGEGLLPILLPIGGFFIARKFGGFIKSIF